MDFKIVATLCSLLAIIGNYAVDAGADCAPTSEKCCTVPAGAAPTIASSPTDCDGEITVDGACSISRSWTGGDDDFKKIGGTSAGAYLKCIAIYIKHKEELAQKDKNQCYKNLVEACPAQNPDFKVPKLKEDATPSEFGQFWGPLVNKMCFPKSTGYQNLLDACRATDNNYAFPTAIPTAKPESEVREALDKLADAFCKPPTAEESYNNLINKCKEKTGYKNPLDTISLSNLVTDFCEPHILKEKKECANCLVETCTTDALYVNPLTGLTGNSLSAKLNEIAQNVCKPPVQQMYEICKKDYPASPLIHTNPFLTPEENKEDQEKLVSDQNKAFCMPKVVTDKSSVEFLIQACTERKTEFPQYKDPRQGLNPTQKEQLFKATATEYCNQTAAPGPGQAPGPDLCVYTRTGAVEKLIKECKGDSKYKKDYKDPLEGLTGLKKTEKLNELAGNYCNQTAGGGGGGCVDPTPCPQSPPGKGGAGKTYIGLSSLWMFFTILNQ